MEDFRERYGSVKGKKDSLYLYVLYECTQDKLKEHVKKQLEIIDRINDAYKRRLFSSRYILMREYIEKNLDDHVYNEIIFVGDTLDSHRLESQYKALLKRFEHQNISFVYDNCFRMEYLEDLIFNDKPYNLYRVTNNKIDYIHITKTKKVVVSSKEEKALDIKSFIDTTLPSKNRYILYGVSSRLKDYVDDRAYTVVGKHLKDDEMIDMINRIDQEDVLTTLDDDLAMMRDPRQMHKVCFKKEILEKIKNAQLQRLYIDKKMHEKFVENVKKMDLDISFNIIPIDTTVKSFTEGKEHVLDQYGGVVGVTYY